jgi:hypothetical protein
MSALFIDVLGMPIGKLLVYGRENDLARDPARVFQVIQTGANIVHYVSRNPGKSGWGVLVDHFRAHRSLLPLFKYQKFALVPSICHNPGMRRCSREVSTPRSYRVA